jgi:hypothetical protein
MGDTQLSEVALSSAKKQTPNLRKDGQHIHNEQQEQTATAQRRKADFIFLAM